MIDLREGDCREIMRALPENSVDSVVTDPPYEIGFMAKKWDASGVAFNPATWREALRVLKPGGHLLAFGGTRTYHRMACAIEDAGFEIRDQLGWAYGSGFPKSHNGDWGGTALKPAWEPICMARKPLIGTVEANWLVWGTGGLRIDECRVEGMKGTPASPRRAKQGAAYGELGNDPGTGSGWDASVGRWPANLVHDGSDEVIEAFPDAKGQQGFAGAKHGDRPSINTYGDWGPRPDTAPRGDTGSAARFFYCAKASKSDRNAGCENLPPTTTTDGRAVATDNAYQRGKTERNNHHPTVKPTALMQWLVRLVTPRGGVVLDPFMGSGSTGRGCVFEALSFIGCEMHAPYLEIARARIAAAEAEVLW